MKFPAPRRAQADQCQATPPLCSAPTSRREQLRNQLPGLVSAIQGLRAHLFPEGFLADYLALNWLEWHAGALRVTVTGGDVCGQMRLQQA